MVTMRVRPHLMIYFQSVMVGRYEVLEKGEDWYILKVKYTVFEEARTAVLGLGVDAEVIDPPSSAGCRHRTGTDACREI